MRTIWHSRRFQISLEWRRWVVGIMFPHGGMLVWCFYLGPLGIEYWPAAPDLDEAPF